MITGKVDLEGQTIASGRYAVSRVLGEGNMGLVYRAQDHNLDSEVVIKVPTVASLEDPEFVERFRLEIRSMVKLTHPHVVNILDQGAHVNDAGDSIPYVVMHYLSGGSLKDRFYENDSPVPMPAESLEDWLLEVGKALDFIHKQGYIHRDVKPANILFDEHGNPFLSDFGLAKVLSESEKESVNSASLTAAGFLVGTPNYVAPELVMGERAGPQVDQYSLAMTVFEVLTATCPMEGPTASATMVNQTNKQPPSPDTIVDAIPPGVCEAILRGLSKSSEDRFGSCTEFAKTVIRGLREVSGGSMMASRVQRRTTPAARTRDPGSRRRSTTSSPELPPKVSGKSRLPPKTGGGKRPKGSRQKTQTGQKGRVRCPSCRRMLPLKPEHAGRRGRCIHCKSRLEVGKDLRSLKLVGESSLSDTTTGASGSTGRHSVTGEELLIGERVFGWNVNKKTAIILFCTLLVLLVGTSVYIGIRASHDPDKAREEEVDNNRRGTEG